MQDSIDLTTEAMPDRERAEREAQMRRALRGHATEFLVAVGRRGEILASTASSHLGWTTDGASGRHIAERLHPDDLPRVFDVLERARTTRGFAERLIVRAQNVDGTWHHLEATVMDANVGSDPIEGAAVVRVRDLTVAGEVPGGEPDAGDSDDNSRFHSLAEALPLGILSADARGWVVYTNHAATSLLGRTDEEMVGSGWLEAAHPDDVAELADAAQSVIDSGQPGEVSFRTTDGDGVGRWVHARLVPLGRERRNGWIATLEDITQRQQAQSRLAHLATHDALTGLPNRLLLHDRLGQACVRLRRGSHSVTVLFVDLDSFKKVNDTYGHAMGDQVLAAVARRLEDATREDDTVARLGGDEFVIICESGSEMERERIAERIRDMLTQPIRIGGQEITLGASVGSVTVSDPSSQVSDMLGMADQAMYRVKERRRQTDR